MKTLAWFSKYLLLPLTPFFIGVLFRYLHQGCFRFNFLKPAELNFSMAMLSLVVSVNASKITNPTLRTYVVSSFRAGLYFFLALFALSIFLDIDIQNSLTRICGVFELAINSKAVITSSDLLLRLREFEAILSRVRWVTIVLAILTIIFACIYNKRYKLEDL